MVGLLCLEFWWKAKTEKWIKTEYLRGIECAWTQQFWPRGTKMYLVPLAEPGRGSPSSQCLIMLLFFFFPQEKSLPPLHGLGVSWHQAQPALLLLTMLHTLGMYLLTAQELEGPRAIRIFNISATRADKRTSKSSRASPPTAKPQEASGQAQ